MQCIPVGAASSAGVGLGESAHSVFGVPLIAHQIKNGMRIDVAEGRDTDASAPRCISRCVARRK